MSIYLATGITYNYLDRAREFLDSAQHVCNVPVTVFAVNFDDAQMAGHPREYWPRLNWVQSDYNKVKAKLPKWMLQVGSFAEFAPPHWKDLDTIIFTDSDAHFQRPFTEAELELFRSVSLGECAVGYNMPNNPQSLLDEAPRLSPLKSIPEIARLFPGMEKMACRNFGFVVADFATWRELYRRYLQIHERIEATFANPARVQWGALWALQQPASGLKLLELSPVIHAHGHVGRKHGLVKGQDGTWRQDGEVIAYAHAL